MHLPTTIADLAMLVLLPVLLIVLIAAWLLYASRGRRDVAFKLEGFGIRLNITSNDRDDQHRRLGEKDHVE